MQALILAGGLGTRLRQISGNLPKPLVPIGGRPILDRQLEQLARGGCEHVVILTGYAGKQIAEYCGSGERHGAKIRCLQETTARGTAGAVLDSWGELEERFVVLYGDTVLSVDLPRMMSFHQEQAADITLFVHASDHPQDSDLVDMDAEDRVRGLRPYPHPDDGDYGNLTNAGLYIIEKAALALAVRAEEFPEKPDFIRHVFPRLLRCGVRFAGYRSPEYIKDAGTPERFAGVECDLMEGRVERNSLRNPAPGVLLDRDGTLIEDRGHLSQPGDLALLPGTAAAVAKLNRGSLRTAIITNQPVIARGECDETGLQRIHNRLETLLGMDHAHVDKIYYCPHHPTGGFPGERSGLKMLCTCRKPGTAMVERAMRELNLDRHRSWFIGDSTTDLATARRAGIRSILVKTGLAGRDGKWPCLPDYECRDLADAVGLILDCWPRLHRQICGMKLNMTMGSVLLIGGLARSGKSTVAAVLAETYRELGIGAVVIPLDCFLKGSDQNRGTTVLDRYDVGAAIAFLQDALLHSGTKRLARYDRVLRRAIPDGTEIEVPRDPLLILEGVPALAHPELRSIASDSIYVTRPETDRLQAITLDYQWRGWDVSRISALMASRAVDETPIIEGSKPYAGAIFDPVGL